MVKKVFLVTVKLPKDPNHDPDNKVIGKCINGRCTDSTGEYHTLLFMTPEGVADVENTGVHVTRVETTWIELPDY